MQKISVSRDEMLVWAEKSGLFFGLDMDRISTVLLTQICSLHNYRKIAGYEITDEIKYLEGIWKATTTPAPDIFKHDPLTGLYKKHFTAAPFISQNIKNSITGSKGKKNFDRIFNEAYNLSDSNDIDIDRDRDKLISYIAYQLTIGSYFRKIANKSVTGEWIVFHKYNNLNYYLTLGRHKEKDITIFSRAVLACKIDNFPFELGKKK